MKYYLALCIKWFPLAVHIGLLIAAYAIGLLETIKGNPMAIEAEIFWSTNFIILIILLIVATYKISNWVDKTLQE